jgi:microcystin-dependent protein
MADQYLGQILLFPFNFTPVGFAMCQGQVMSISQNTALFSLLGTMYGGNGTTNFALPDLRARVPMGSGQGPGLSPRVIGEVAGTETITLAPAEAAPHTHAVDISGLSATAHGSSASADRALPVGATLAVEAASVPATYSSAAPDASMATGSVVVGGSMAAGASGGSQAHENRQPYLTLNYCIAIQGVFPPRP